MKRISHIIPFLILLALSGAVAAQTPLKMRDTTIKGPQTFAMIVGISKYKYIRPLNYADKDATLFRDYLLSPGGGSVKEDNLFCLLNEKANNSNFWGKGFQWLKAKNLQKGDRLFIYLAGHGDAIDQDQFFFLSYDCNPGGDKNNYLVAGAIQLFNLKKKIALETSKGVEVFFIMDACRSSELPGGIIGQNFLNTAISEKKAGEVIMLATGAGQESLEDASLGNGHGLFTYYLVDGLSGLADSILDNKISFREIQSYVDKNVPSVAEQRFKRRQYPYFCCNESSDKVISFIDTAYLSKWLKTKKLQNRGPGNSFPEGAINKRIYSRADTSLVETYNLFYKAINENRLTGQNSAEEYYRQLDKKFRNNPYTLDAKSTLAVEYINYAQERVNQYLSCTDALSSSEKQNNYEAGVRLEKAIAILKEDEPDFANSYLGRMYFLKASGDFGKNGKNGDISVAFQNAYAALAIDPGGAYINNRLATLHLDNGNADSAQYYASRALRFAPKWKCAYATMAIVYRRMNLPDSASVYQQRALTADPSRPIVITKEPKEKVPPRFGYTIGGGFNRLNSTNSNWRQGNIDYNDSLTDISTNGRARLDLGVSCWLSLSGHVSLRPSLLITLESSDITYGRRNATGLSNGEKITLSTTAVTLPIPFVFTFSGGNATPFISIGPALSYIFSQSSHASITLPNRPPGKVPLQSFNAWGDAGIGTDISLPQSSFILSLELKYSAGLTDLKKSDNTLYTNTLSSLKKQAYTFSFFLRRK